MRFEEKDKQWPFRPDHITCDGDDRGLKGTGIITSRHLQGIQSEICHAVEQPTTIVEFGIDGKPIRTDSPLLTYAMHPACNRFRQRNLEFEENGKIIVDNEREPATGALCTYCDNCHARLLRGMKKDKLMVETVMNRKDEDSDLRKLYNGVSCLFEPKVYEERLVVQYDCPLLGYRELFFPIIFEYRVVGVFFLGQITIEGQQEFIEDMIESLTARFPGCFAAYLNRYYDGNTPETLTVEILQEHRHWLHENPKDRILSQKRYEEVIRTTIKELKAFEGLLADEVNHQRITYIRQHISLELERFARHFEPSGEHERVDDDTLKDLWNRVQDSINRLVESFSLRYVLVFGVKRIIQTTADRLEVVAMTKRWNEVSDSEEDLRNLYIDTKLLPDGYLVCSRKEDEQYLKCLQGCNLDRLGDFQLALVPVTPHRQSSIAFLLGYNEEHPHTADENLPGNVLDATLHSFENLVVSSLAAILAREAEETAKNQLQYLGHEAGQLVTGLDWLRMSYFEKAKDLRRLPTNKIEDICQDLEELIGQMAFIFNMASQIGSDMLPEVEISEFKPFGEVLFKWKDTYRLEIRQKCLQIRVADLDPQDPWRPAIYADKFLFEQVVYNLVNNAEKYSYRGTKIDLDCKLRSLDEDLSPHVLTVTNYGRYMAPGRDVYLPFTRRETTGDIVGLGLGLYIAGLIVERVHGGRISHHCEKYPVSWFNIPLIKPYIERPFEGKDPGLVKKLEAELHRLKTTQDYNRIVAFSDIKKTPKYEPTDDVLRNEIHKPTYKVTIIATIPVRERKY